MPILLDETTRAEYLAQSIASTRASLVVGALSGTVVVEVYDGFNVLRASGTMASPWATSSSATITIGEVNAAGLTVTSGGAPTADWYCQFRSGTRFVRGTFGVLGSGRDFTWSLASFDTGSRGTIGTVLIAAAGNPDVIAPVNIAVPSVIGTPQVGQSLTLTAGTWANQPSSFSAQWQRSSTLGGTYSAISGATLFAYTPVAGDQSFFIRAQVVATNVAGSGQAFSAAVGPVQAAAPASETLTSAPTITAFSGTTTTVGGILQVNPARWVNDRPANQYPIQQRFQWNLNGSPITDAVGLAYTPTQAGTYTVTETVFRVGSPSTTTTTTTAPVVITGTRDAALVTQADVEWLGCFQLPYPPGAVSDNRSFAYGSSLAFNPGGNGGAGSLFIGGHFEFIQIGEVSIPTLSTTLGGMQTASLLSGSTLVDPSEGRMRNRGVYTSGLMGLHVNGSHLYMTEVQGYSANRASWMYRRPLNLATTGAVEGPFAVADYTRGSLNADNPRALAGVMANVPSAWQSALGGEMIIGNVADSIVSVASDGPSVAGFSASTVSAASSGNLIRSAACQGGTSNTITLDAGASSVNGFYVNCYVTVPSMYVRAMKITAYNGSTRVATVDRPWEREDTSANTPPTAGSTYFIAAGVQASASALYGNGQLQSSDTNWTYPQVWNHTGTLRGLVVPNGTRSVLAIGRIGNGIYAYGAQDEIIENIRIYDPDGEGRGERSFPYYSRIWAYDINALQQARTGAVALNAVRPYAAFHLFAPIAWKGYPGPGGAAYDPATRRLYVLANWALNFGNPAVHVFRINNAVAA